MAGRFDPCDHAHLCCPGFPMAGPSESAQIRGDGAVDQHERFGIFSDILARSRWRGRSASVVDAPGTDPADGVGRDCHRRTGSGYADAAHAFWSCTRGSATAVRHRTFSRSSKDERDRKSTRLNSSHVRISYAVFCLKKKKKNVPAARIGENEPNANDLP